MEEEISLSQITFALHSIENTQDSVVKASQLMLNKGSTETSSINSIINSWTTTFDEHIINNEGAKKLLAMLYVSNDVLQKCKMQKCEKFIEEFKQVLPVKFQSFYDYHLTTPKFKIEIIKMLNIWKQRRIYPNEFLTSISPQQQVPPIQIQKENQLITEQEQIVTTPTKKQAGEDNFSDLPENIIQIPKDLITFAQSQKDLIKWHQKSKEFETKLHMCTKKTGDTQYMLEEFKRSQELQQKYRTLMLRSLADILQSDDMGHLKMVLELKKLAQKKKELQEIEEQIATMQTTF